MISIVTLRPLFCILYSINSHPPCIIFSYFANISEQNRSSFTITFKPRDWQWTDKENNGGIATWQFHWGILLEKKEKKCRKVKQEKCRYYTIRHVRMANFYKYFFSRFPAKYIYFIIEVSSAALSHFASRFKWFRWQKKKTDLHHL